MGGRSRSERAASLRARQDMFGLMQAARERRLLRAEATLSGSDHRLVDFTWTHGEVVPSRFASIEAVEEFLNG